MAVQVVSETGIKPPVVTPTVVNPAVNPGGVVPNGYTPGAPMPTTTTAPTAPVTTVTDDDPDKVNTVISQADRTQDYNIQNPGATSVKPAPSVTAPTQTVTTSADARQQDYQANQGIVQQPTQTVIDPEEARRREYEIANAGRTGTETIKEETAPDGTKTKVTVKEPIKPPDSGVSPTPQPTGTTPPKTTTPGTTPPKTVEPAPIRPPELTESEKYLKNVQNMKFSYNAGTDPEYRQAAAQLENDVAQMMIGRGGLYSSVTSSALQSGLMSLQIQYTKLAYEKFLQERDFQFKMADYIAGREDAAWQKDFQTKQFNASREDAAWEKGFEEKKYTAGREDAEWEKNFNMAKFNADLEQQKFENSMATAQFNFQKQQAAYARQQRSAANKSASDKEALNGMLNAYQIEEAKYNKMRDDWLKNGVASPEVAAYFKVKEGAPVSMYSNRLYQAAWNLKSKSDQIAAFAESINDADTYQAAINQFQKENTVDPKVAEQQKTTDQSNAYFLATNTMRSKHLNDGMSYFDIYKIYDSQKQTLINGMGLAKYNQLMDELSSLAEKELNG